MMKSLSISDNIRQAQQCQGPSFDCPVHSFAELFYSRMSDSSLVSHIFLSYHDSDTSDHRFYTYARFGKDVRRLVTVMKDRLGMKRGDRIATVLFNHDLTVQVYFAAWLLGSSVVPISITETPERKRYIIEHSGAVIVFCWKDIEDEIRNLVEDLSPRPDVVGVGDPASACTLLEYVKSAKPAEPVREGSLHDEALVVYTSGTTGLPKGVVLTVRNLVVDAAGIAQWHGVHSGEAMMCVLPIHHVNGIVVTLLTPFYAKGRVVLNKKFKTGEFWRLVRDERIVYVSVVPTLLEYLLERPKALARHEISRFRGVICGAGPLFTETIMRFEDQFQFPVCHGYGLTETTCYACFMPPDLSPEVRRIWTRDYDLPSIGVPLGCNDMAVMNEQGGQVSDLTKGEICIRGETICSGYLNNPMANDAAFQWGWFRSGDEGFVVHDEHNRPFFFISGRLKELIIRGGVNIAPLEIDEVLRGHPGVKFAMALPFENRYYGEEIAGYVVPKEDANPSEAELLAFCRQRLPFAKCPKVMVFGKEVPYTTTGKPKRLALKQQLREILSVFRETRFKNSFGNSQNGK